MNEAAYVKWCVPGVTFLRLADGFPGFEIDNGKCKALISLYGGQLLSFTPAGAEPIIYMCRGAQFKTGKAIRGGVPLCAPWFGAATTPGLPAHGAVRLAVWSPESVSAEAITLKLSAAGLPEQFRHLPFEFTLKFTLSKILKIELTTVNIGAQPADFTAAMHSYFAVSDVARIKVRGLDGAAYFDAAAGKDGVQHGDVTVEGEIDRIYQSDSTKLEIIDASRTICLEKQNSRATVMWNPGAEKAKGFADLDDAEYPAFICVETANTREDARVLQPGESHTLGSSIYLA